MKTFTLQCFFWFTAFSLIFCGCKSSRPALLHPSNPEAFTAQSTKNVSAVFHPEQYAKTAVKMPGKVLYAANTALPEPIAAHPTPSLKSKLPAIAPVFEQSEKAAPVILKKQDEPEKAKGRWLSGVFLAAGMVLLLVALILLLTGTSAAGTVALIGGGALLMGFIFAMVALLGR